MASRRPLSEDKIREALTGLNGWQFRADGIEKSFQLGDFKEAVSFIVRLAFYAEAHDHHPELFNVYNRVDLRLSTHDAGDKVTEKDIELAREIERFAWR